MTGQSDEYFKMRDIIARCLEKLSYDDACFEDLADDVIKALDANGYEITLRPQV